MEDKLLNKIKLIISPYLERGEYGNDFKSGKVSMAKEISDAIDFVNDKNLQLSNIENGEIVFDDVLKGIPAMRGFVPGNDGLYLRLTGDCIDMHLKTIPFVPEDGKDDFAGTFRVIIQKVETPKKTNKVRRSRKPKDKIEKDGIDEAMEYYNKLQQRMRIVNNGEMKWYIPKMADLAYHPVNDAAAVAANEVNLNNPNI